MSDRPNSEHALADQDPAVPRSRVLLVIDVAVIALTVAWAFVGYRAGAPNPKSVGYVPALAWFLFGRPIFREPGPSWSAPYPGDWRVWTISGLGAFGAVALVVLLAVLCSRTGIAFPLWDAPLMGSLSAYLAYVIVRGALGRQASSPYAGWLAGAYLVLGITASCLAAVLV